MREGQIRAEAVVRRSVPGTGLELKFLAVSEQDRPKLAALMSRLRSLSHSAANHKHGDKAILGVFQLRNHKAGLMISAASLER